MTTQLRVSGFLVLAGLVSACIAVWNERRMQRHRQPGVTYAAVTLRRDGGWRRAELFTPRGLVYPFRASLFGVTAAVLWLTALVSWVLLAG